jgi:hypothetical protein
MPTQPVTSQPVNPSTQVVSLLIPISYSLATVILLTGIGAFLGQLFRLGKD